MIGDDRVGAGAAHRDQVLQHESVSCTPAVLGQQLDRGVLASLRGSGIATGGGGSAAGPNVVQNITNNNVEITVNVDAKGAPAGVAERAREGGQAGAQAVDRIVNGQLAMTKLRNGAGRR